LGGWEKSPDGPWNFTSLGDFNGALLEKTTGFAQDWTFEQ
jgi:hypothetical protein